jgi:hypothetical protein
MYFHHLRLLQPRAITGEYLREGELRTPDVRMIMAGGKLFSKSPMRGLMQFPKLLLDAIWNEAHLIERRQRLAGCARGVRDLRPVKTISPAELHVCSVLLVVCSCRSEGVEATSSYSAASHCYTIIRVKEKRALGPIADVPEMPHCPAGKVP